MKYLYKIFIILVYLIPVLLLGYLIMLNINPELNISYSLDGRNRMVSELVPLSRVSDIDFDTFGKYRSITSEPVYLDVSIPRKYDKVEVVVEYSDLQIPVFDIGISRNDERTTFDFVSLENNTLESLGWNKIEYGGLVLYQRSKKYDTMDGFLANPSTFRDTIVYRTDLDPYIAERYSKGVTDVVFPIKQKLQMMVYHLGGELKIDVATNKEYVLNIFKDSQLVSNGENNLSKGMYKVELIGDMETIFSHIKINSPYVAILNSINLGELKTPIKLYSTTSKLLFKTEEVSGLQTIKIDGKPLEIEQSFTQYNKNFDNRWIKQINIDKGNLEIDGTLFFIHNWNLFYPVYEKFYPEINLDNVNFILAKQNNNYLDEAVVKTRKATFNLENTPTPYNKIRFLLSLPTSKDMPELVKIRGIKFYFTGEKMDLADIFYKVIKKIRDLRI